MPGHTRRRREGRVNKEQHNRMNVKHLPPVSLETSQYGLKRKTKSHPKSWALSIWWGRQNNVDFHPTASSNSPAKSWRVFMKSGWSGDQFPLGDHCEQMFSISEEKGARKHSDPNWQFPLLLNNVSMRGRYLWLAHSNPLSHCCHGVRTPPRDAHHSTGTIIPGQPHLQACLTAQFDSTQWYKEEKRH